MAKTPICCPSCERTVLMENGAVNRAMKKSAPLYCGRVCAGLARRKAKSEAQRKQEKAQYDSMRRIVLAPQIKAAKAKAFKETYDPQQAAIYRKGRASWHAEYCRRPEYRAWKKTYDRQHRAVKKYGEYAEASIILMDVEDEVSARMSRYDIQMANGTLNKAHKRKNGYGY